MSLLFSVFVGVAFNLLCVNNRLEHIENKIWNEKNYKVYAFNSMISAYNLIGETSQLKNVLQPIFVIRNGRRIVKFLNWI